MGEATPSLRCRKQICTENLLPFLFRRVDGLGNKSVLWSDARIVHQNIESSELVADCLGCGFAILRVGYVKLEGNRLDPIRLELRSSFFSGLQSPGSDNDRHA